MGAAKNTLIRYAMWVRPGDVAAQERLEEDILNGEFSLDLEDMARVLDGQWGEFCNACGISVAVGTEKHHGRFPDYNTVETRISIGRQFPAGNFLCALCNESCGVCAGGTCEAVIPYVPPPEECDHLDDDGECYPPDSDCPNCGTYIAPMEGDSPGQAA